MKKATGIKRLINASIYSMQGLASCFRTEEAFRLECIGAAILAPVGLWLGETGAEKALLAGSVLLLMVVEIMNTAIERIVDRISTDLHVLSGEAKDMGSAAVMLTFFIALMTWTLILVL